MKHRLQMDRSNAAQAVLKLITLTVAMSVATLASAQTAGTWMGTLGINTITPKVDSGDVSAPALPGTKVGVNSDTEPTFLINYMLTDNISTELALGLPYKHDLSGAGAIAGTGKLASAQVLPPTVLLQYRFFKPDAMVRPYLGVGVTYAYFRKETGSGQLSAIIDTGGPASTFSLKNKFAASIQVGTTVAINARWFADIAIIKTYLKTTASYSTGQTQEVRLDPLAVSVGIGYRF